ncbi:MAG: heavy metal translocating P-type ATPase [Rhodospirillales bacterium]
MNLTIRHDQAVNVDAVPASPAHKTPFVRELPDGLSRLHLMVDNIHCAGCIRKIEKALHDTPGVARARVNLSTRRLVVDWTPSAIRARDLIDIVTELGFPAAPFDPDAFGTKDETAERRLLLSMAVAGFAAANVMLLSVSVWSGHDGSMGVATRDLFHWISALIALPAIVYAGQPFFRSAWAALSRRQLNMDVPISLAVVLAAGMSLYQTAVSGQHAYFDAAVGLLFFLLIGRYLDQRARTKARSAAQHLIRLTATGANILMQDGTVRSVAVNDLSPGMTMVVAAGERLAADGLVTKGRSAVDNSLMTGESMPVDIGPEDRVYAGTINLTAPIEVRIEAAGDDSLLAEIVRLVEAAEQGRARYVRIADRVARIYAPAVHVLAAIAFVGWLIAGADWMTALMTAVAVLIITCPCALGLAVPTAQTVASGLLMRHGVLLKSGDGLERLAATDVCVFDKTGTLTLGRPELVNRDAIDAEDLAISAALARRSRHPLCQALANAAGVQTGRTVTDISELSGRGIEGVVDGETINLGSAAWLGVDRGQHPPHSVEDDGCSEVWMVRDGRPSVVFRFRDTLRPDARATVEQLRGMGIAVRILSGDRRNIVDSFAAQIGIDPADCEAESLPAAKAEQVRALTDAGHKVLMVGDGLNDAPALAEGYASMSPATAANVSQTAADVIFQGESLMAVADTINLARATNRTVIQNFGLAFTYNLFAVPLAMAGVVTPLFAAIAMSGSSIVVVANSLRLGLLKWGKRS